MPCSIRDHWLNFRENILSDNCKPEDEYAEEALKSTEYNEILKQFDKDLNKKTKPIWKKEYLEEK